MITVLVPYFDGRCAVCREWIKSHGDMWTTLAEPPEDFKHTIAHARCIPADRAQELSLRDQEAVEAQRRALSEQSLAVNQNGESDA